MLASRRNAGMATSSSASPSWPGTGDVNVRSSLLSRSRSEPSPARLGKKGNRHAAACSPRWNNPSSSGSSSMAPAWRAARK